MREFQGRDDLKVSICMISYNHEKYIHDAIKGVVSQKTGFKFELIIGDDYSTDNTRGICLSYQEKYPEIIKLLPSDQNLGVSVNFTRTLMECKGEYIALCEGDDFWTDSGKLQKQVHFLDSNPEYSFCFHNASLTGGNYQMTRSYFVNNNKGKYDYIDFLTNDSFPPLSSIMYRNYPGLLKPFINCSLKARDIILTLLILEKGTGFYFDEIMSCRRLHESGVWSGLNTYNKLNTQIQIRKEYLEYYKNHKFSKALSKNLINKLFSLNRILFKEHRYFKLIANIISVFFYSMMDGHIKYSLKLFLKK
jgi:glycosyltransferase involved in cell wall biosynthesis